MRLLQLECSNVGQWREPLSMRLSPRLTIVLGDNEAGKSTLRRALRALLFGPDRELAAPVTVATFDMAAEVSFEGYAQHLHRRGRGLQSEISHGLRALLAEKNAGRFADLFDLAHDNLLPQDEGAFLNADGVLGSLMFGVRLGVSPGQLQAARQRVEKELRELDSRAQRAQGIPFFRTRFQQAHQALQQLAKFDQSDERNALHQALQGKVDTLEREWARLAARKRYLQGLIECSDEVSELASLQQTMATLSGGGVPPPSTEVAELRQRQCQLVELSRRVDEARVALDEAAAALARAEPPGELHSLVPDCDLLRGVVAEHAAASHALDELRQQRSQVRAQLVQALERMGAAPGDAPEASGKALLRPEPLAEQLRDLISTHQDLMAVREQRRGLADAAKRSLDALESQACSTADLDTGSLDRALELLTQACEAEAELKRLQLALDETAPKIRSLQAELAFAVEVRGPHDIPLPQEDACSAAEEALSNARSNLESRSRELQRLVDELTELDDQLAKRRGQAGSLASPEDVRLARELRDQCLQAVLHGLTISAPDLASLINRANELRQLIRQSDLLIDGRVDAGETLGQLRADEQRAEALKHQLAGARHRLESAEQALKSCEGEVASLWQCLRQPPSDAAYWFERYHAWKEAWDAREQQRLTRDALARQLETTCRDALAMAGREVPRLTKLASAVALRQEVTREREKRVSAAAQVAALEAQRKQAKATLAGESDALARAESDIEAWRMRWAASIAALPEGLGAEPAAVQKWLDLQLDLRRSLTEVEGLEAKFKARIAETNEKRERIDALVQRAMGLSPELQIPAGIEPSAAFRLVDEASKRSQGRHADQNALAADCRRAENTLEQAIRAQETLQATLLREWTQLGQMAPLSTPTVEALAALSTRWEALKVRSAQIEASLGGRWGSAAKAAIEEIQSSGTEVVQAQLHDVDEELSRIRRERDEAADERRDAERALEEMRQGSDATEILQELADARESLFERLGQRYRLGAAKLILDRAYREASDGGQAIEAAASEYFKQLTDGVYAGLRIDHDQPGEPKLLAVESPRSEKTLDHLSAGTRDQLWLALRLAAIVAAAKETPFPLLLDDSLVQFDDQRASAALRLLYGISEHVQVILFSHHDHLVQLAEQAVTMDDLGIVVLPKVDGTVRRLVGAPLARRERPVLEHRGQESEEDDVETIGGEYQPRGAGSGRGNRSHVAQHREDAKDLIVEVLSERRQRMGKAALIAAVAQRGTDIDGFWNQVMRELREEQRIMSEGKNKGAEYYVD